MSQTASTRQHYYVPQPMPWPIMGSTALFLMALGAVFVFNGSSGGWFSIGLGFMILLYMLFRWFGSVIRESEGGKYGGWEDISFRWGMSWFIFSEVMFFRFPTWRACKARPWCGPISPATGPRRDRHSPRSSRRWRLGASPRSTRCCCCPPA